MRNIVVILLIYMLVTCCNSSGKSKPIGDYSAKKNISNQSSELKESITRGAEVYNDLCITCHLPNGKGVSGSFPPLAQSDYLMIKRNESIKAIKYGLKGEITVNGETYNMPMLPLGLSDEEIADVMNYITNSWGNENTVPITVKEVSQITP